MRMLVGMLWAACAMAQAPLPVYEAHRAAGPVKVDGKLDEAAWQAAAPVTLQFPWNVQRGAKQKTTARLLWDDRYLYVGYECDDADITATRLQRDDPTYMDDAVELYINPNAKLDTAYYGMEMNARGVMYDYLMIFPAFQLVKQYQLNGFELKTQIRGTLNQSGDADQGWTLELAVPLENFADLATGPVRPGSVWRMNLVRWDGTEPARRLSIWSDSQVKDTSPHNPKRLGMLRFVE